MQTCALENLLSLYFVTPTSEGLTITDSRQLMGADDETPALERDGYALVLNEDRGEDGTDEPEGYIWTSFQLTPAGVWEETGTGYAADDETVRDDMAVWWRRISMMSAQDAWHEEDLEKARALVRVRTKRAARERAEAALHEQVREAAAEGVSERRLAEASGISRMTVRRILGRD